MTVIAGMVHQGQAWLGADRCGVYSNGRVSSARKLLRLPVGDGHALIAWSGDSRTRHHLSRRLHVEAPRGADDLDVSAADDLDVWASAVAQAVTKINLGALPPIADPDDDKRAEGHGMLAYANRLWRLEQDAAHPVTEWAYAVGSGSDYALGALYALTAQTPNGRLDLTPFHALQIALSAACEWQADCASPLDIEQAGQVTGDE